MWSLICLYVRSSEDQHELLSKQTYVSAISIVLLAFILDMPRRQTLHFWEHIVVFNS